jgi:uncharacterized protein (DUF1499 family)
MLAAVVSGCASGPVPESGLVDGRLRECPESPNCVSSMASPEDETHFIEPITYTGPRDAARERLLQVIEGRPRTEILEVSASYVHTSFTTAVMRFVDDVEFFLPGDERVIHVRSASRIGYSDLGTNRRRVDELRAELSP